MYLLVNIETSNNSVNNNNIILKSISFKYWNSFTKMENVIVELIKIFESCKLINTSVNIDENQIIENYNNLTKQLEWINR